MGEQSKEARSEREELRSKGGGKPPSAKKCVNPGTPAKNHEEGDQEIMLWAKGDRGKKSRTERKKEKSPPRAVGNKRLEKGGFGKK